MIDSMSSRLPQLDTFCLFLSLRTGSFILGSVVCVFEIIKYVGLSIIFLFELGVHGSGFFLASLFHSIEVLFSVISLVEPITCIVFLIGLYKSKAAYMLPGLLLYFIKIIDFIMLGLLLLFTHHLFYFADYFAGAEDEPSDPHSSSPALGAVISCVKYSVLGTVFVYSFLVVNSYFNVLRRGRDVDRLMEEEV